MSERLAHENKVSLFAKRSSCNWLHGLSSRELPTGASSLALYE